MNLSQQTFSFLHRLTSPRQSSFTPLHVTDYLITWTQLQKLKNSGLLGAETEPDAHVPSVWIWSAPEAPEPDIEAGIYLPPRHLKLDQAFHQMELNQSTKLLPILLPILEECSHFFHIWFASQMAKKSSRLELEVLALVDQWLFLSSHPLFSSIKAQTLFDWIFESPYWDTSLVHLTDYEEAKRVAANFVRQLLVLKRQDQKSGSPPPWLPVYNDFVRQGMSGKMSHSLKMAG